MRWSVSAAATLVLLACSSNKDAHDHTFACVSLPDDNCASLYKPTFENVYEQTLQKRCAVAGGACHSTKGAHGGLVLEGADTAYKMLVSPQNSAPLATSENPECSTLLKRIFAHDKADAMPPNNPLSDQEKCAVTLWVRSLEAVPKAGAVEIKFNHLINTEKIALGSTYALDDGITVTISMIRYWISNITLVSAKGSDYVVPDAYYLMEQWESKDRSTLSIPNVPPGEYTAISFALGVDKDANSSLDKFSGELQAGIQMDWSWKTGFIFIKLEGTYVKGDEEPIDYKFHVGTNENYKVISMPFPESIAIDDSTTGQLDMNVDFSGMIKSVDVSETAVVMFGPTAEAVAEAYSGMFTLQSAQSTQLK